MKSKKEQQPSESIRIHGYKFLLFACLFVSPTIGMLKVVLVALGHKIKNFIIILRYIESKLKISAINN